MANPLRALRGLLNSKAPTGNRARSRRTRLCVESLEHRRVLAAMDALPGIAGTVYTDMDSDGIIDAGEGVAGATVRLFQDDGDGIFDANTDTQLGAGVQTDANGEYCFDNLDADATYFVQQPAQLVAGNNLSSRVSPLLETLPSLIIDDFITTQSTVANPPPVSNDSSSLSLPNENEVIGGERDLAVQLTSGTSEVQLRVNPFGLEDVLLFDSSAGSSGERVITWDGQDNDGDALAMGLGGRDLTVGGTLGGFMLKIGVDANGANGRLRMYQGSETNFSESIFAIPVTGGTASQTVFVPFTSFTGAAGPDDVDAIQLFLDTGNTSVDGQIDTIGILGPEIADFANDVQIDLELEKSVAPTDVNNGDQVTWTVTLTNNPDNANSAASGVVVEDTLPDGVTFVSATPSNGTFADGTWTLADPLAPGDAETLTIVTTIDNDVAGGTILTNVAEVTSHTQPDIDSNPNNDDGDQSEDDEANAFVTVGRFIDLELTKVTDTTVASEGDQVTFTIAVTNNENNANTSATDVEIVDTLPDGVTLVNATPSGNGQFNNGVWSLVDPLAPGASQSLQVVTTVDDGVAGDTKLANVAQVIAANEIDVDSIVNNDDGDQSEDDEAMAMFMIGAVVDLEVTKEVDVATVDEGDNLVWTVSVTNNPTTANIAATNVELTDVLPAGVTLVNVAPSGNGTFDNGVWALVDPLAPGSTATLTLTSSVNAGVAGGTKLINTAQVSSVDQADFDSTPGNDDGDQSEDDEAMAMAQVNAQIDLELVKSVDSANVSIGDSVTWTIDITNNEANANADATGVEVSDVLPAGVTFVSATPSNGTFSGNTWTLGTALAPGASETLTIVSTVDATNSGSDVLINTAQVSAANEPDVDSQPDNDDGDQSQDDEDNAQITISPVIDLELTKTVDATDAAVGDQVTWTVSLTNNATNANTNATGVVVTDAIPAGLTVVSSNPSDGTFSGNTWTLADSIAPGETETLSIVTTVDTITTDKIVNIAQVGAANETDFDSQPGNDDGDQSEDDESMAMIQLTPQIDLELTKEVSTATANVGDQVTWTIDVTNNPANANADATGVQVSDVLPSDVTFVSATPSVGTFSGNTWDLGTLAPGANATLSIVSTVDNTADGGDVIVNVAQVSAANETDVDSVPNNDDGDQSEDDEDNAQFTVNSVIDLDIDKSVSQTNVSIGDNVTWTIVVRNDDTRANTPATGVEVRDVLPAGVDFVSSTTANGAYDNGTGIWTLNSALAPGQSATLSIVTTVNAAAEGSSLLNVAEVSRHNETDVDSIPANDDGDQSEDDESPETINVGFQRPLSKRDLLASAQ